MEECTLSWEQLPATAAPLDLHISRAKVPGGWLVIAYSYDKYGHTSGQKALTMTFYPDQKHAWDGASMP